ncbi:MAG: hypothetical protein LBT85_00005 [Bifidobacteriaceae bacterium]|jgi:hypothetical protein|nr:hypothetical protein [Bifidobacteriaceae bacterium]
MSELFNIRKLFSIRKIGIKKVGVLGIACLFGITLFLNGSISANASASQTVLGIAKGGTNANTVQNAQKNLGITYSLFSDKNDQVFPSAKAVHDFLDFRLTNKLTVGGETGNVAQCLLTTDCLKASNWKQGKINTEQNWWTTHYQNESSNFFMTGPVGAIVTGCSATQNCGDASNWGPLKSVPGSAGYIPTITYGEGKFIGVSGARISQCLATTDCSDANSWSSQKNLAGITDQMIGSTYGEGYFIIVGRLNKVTGCLAALDCGDPANWSSPGNIPSSSSAEFRGVAYGEGKFVAAGGRILAQCIQTNDCRLGQSWQSIFPVENIGFWEVSYANGQFIVVGHDYGVVNGVIYRCLATADCSNINNWATITIPNDNFRYVIVAKDKFVAGGRAGKIHTCYITLNCGLEESWQHMDESLGFDIYSLAYGGGI